MDPTHGVEQTPMDLHEIGVGDEIDLSDGLWFVDRVQANHDRTQYTITFTKATADEPSNDHHLITRPEPRDVDRDVCLDEVPDGRHESSPLIKARVPEDWK